ncbi:MAG: hypothetical protein ACT4OO_16380 [Nitrospiraceae bacterium]
MNKKGIGTLLLVILVASGISGCSSTAGVPSSTVSSATVKGEVVMIAGDLQTLDPRQGERNAGMIMQEIVVLPPHRHVAVTLSVDESTKVDGEVAIGDKIEAQVTDTGHALSIHKRS